jgi:hypothetical protein
MNHTRRDGDYSLADFALGGHFFGNGPPTAYCRLLLQSYCWLPSSKNVNKSINPAPHGGFASATPSKTKTKTFLRRKNEEDSASSRWSGPSRAHQRETEQNLPEPDPAR